MSHQSPDCPHCSDTNRGMWYAEEGGTEFFRCSEGHVYTRKEVRQ